MVIKVPAIIDILTLDRLISDVEKSNDTIIDIEFSLDINAEGFSLVPALFQFFLTWKRSEKSGKLIIGRDEYIFSDFPTGRAVTKYHLFLATIIAWDNEIVNQSGQDIKDALRKLNRRLRESLWTNDVDSVRAENSIIIPFIDHLPASVGLLPILYSGDQLRPEQDFENVSDILIGLAASKHQILAFELNKIKEGLNKILYEAFDNTNNWAIRSYTGELQNRSVRAIYGKFHQGELLEMKESEQSTALKTYLNALNLKRPLDVNFKSAFLEISIFDSGSGLVQVLSGKSVRTMTIKEEYDHLIRCLRKNSTSHTSVSTAYGRGAGLYRIMAVLSNINAFLLIRTGRMFLYRDFLSVQFFNKDNGTYNYSLLDIENKSAMPKSRPFVEGTTITILIPRLFSE